jgi:hypothetical protein
MTMTQPAGIFELFDLKNDPFELNNLWDDASSTELKHAMTLRMLALSFDMQDWGPLPTGRA